MIYQCIKCPRIKSGSPFRASGTKQWLCDHCARNSLAHDLQEHSKIEDKKALLKHLMNKADVAKR